MNYEKAYKDALERARCIKNGMIKLEEGDSVIDCIFPELAESEGEKVRKSIIIYLDWLDGRKDYAPRGKYSIRDMIAWLEKQGEKKPVEWSEEDEKIKDGLIASLARISANTRTDSTSINYCFSKEIDWLKSIKQRIGG